MSLAIRVMDSIDAFAAPQWNAHCGSDPFINWHFLHALEQTGAASPEQGWQACHLRLDHADGSLRAALPCYRKTHSHGDFVYDWGWARAVHNAGLQWYPKLVAAVPYSPVTGPRLLRQADDDTAAAALAQALILSCREQGLLTAQLLFPPASDQELLREQGFLVRRDYIQFHWHNRAYQCFDDFLAGLRHKKRKGIRQERQQLLNSGVSCRWVDAAKASAEEHRLAHRCYSKTFLEYGNQPVLSERFFSELGQRLPGQLWYCIAQRHDPSLGVTRDIAAAIYLSSEHCLYGRYWGALESLPGLHFEVCYYQGIEFCIQRGLQRFEPGVHGEHKISRGFLPAPSLSAHYLNQQDVARAARQWLRQEQDWMHHYRDEIIQRSPYHPEVTDDLLARN